MRLQQCSSCTCMQCVQQPELSQYARPRQHPLLHLNCSYHPDSAMLSPMTLCRLEPTGRE